MEQRLRKEINDSTRIKEDFKRINRTGRQPTLSGSTKQQKKKREDRVSGRSFEESSQDYTDSSSNSKSFTGMIIPEMSDNAEDDRDYREPRFGSDMNKDLQNTFGYTSSVAKEQLSVIMSERESGTILQDSEKSDYDEEDDNVNNTLRESKEVSRSRRINK